MLSSKYDYRPNDFRFERTQSRYSQVCTWDKSISHDKPSAWVGAHATLRAVCAAVFITVLILCLAFGA